jgi:Isoleucyl-tRNA synthetase (EC 6.1.1.5)
MNTSIGLCVHWSELCKKGFIYRGLKPVNWCFNCETALAEAEVEYEDHTSPSIYVKFKVKNPENIFGLPKNKDLNLVIWTTTPWTLIANVAVAVHPHFSYNLIETEKEITGFRKEFKSIYIGKMLHQEL